MKINSIAPKISNMIGASITNLGIALQKSGSMADKLNNIFPGTIVNMKFNFDDNKKYLLATELEENRINKKDLL